MDGDSPFTSRPRPDFAGHRRALLKEPERGQFDSVKEPREIHRREFLLAVSWQGYTTAYLDLKRVYAGVLCNRRS